MSHADANRVYFDSISDTYDTNPTFVKVNHQVTEAWRAHIPWIGIPLHKVTAEGDSTEAGTKPVRFLDYACGTGLMTSIFAPYITHATAIDISPKMLAAYESRFASGPAHLTTTPVLANLLDKSDPSPAPLRDEAFWTHDLAAVGFGFHHFDDAVFAARQLRQRLRPGGVLLIHDFLQGGDVLADERGNMIEGSDGSHGHHHHHHDHSDSARRHDESRSLQSKMAASIAVPDFSEAGIRNIFTQAGFVGVDVVVLPDKLYMEFGGKRLWRTVFFAQGRRPVVEGAEDGAQSEL